MVVVSDGRSTGLDLRAAARRLAARGIFVEYRWLGRESDGLDVAVTGLSGPAQVSAKEPFLLQVTLKATAAAEAQLVLKRNGAPVVKARRALHQGDNLPTLRAHRGARACLLRLQMAVRACIREAHHGVRLD